MKNTGFDPTRKKKPKKKSKRLATATNIKLDQNPYSNENTSGTGLVL